MRKPFRFTAWLVLLICAVSSSGCSEEVGVGISVGVPVGHQAGMSVGTSGWY